jgi:hypothetical protein
MIIETSEDSVVAVNVVRKRPIEHVAIQWDGTHKHALDIVDVFGNGYVAFTNEEMFFIIRTLEGEVRASKGSWIIKGVKDECWPVADEVFQLSYDIIS